MSADDIRPGDTVRLSREAVLTDLNDSAVTIRTPDGGYSGQRTYSRRDWDITVVRRAPRTPEHWPPQAGDVWRDRDGEEWFIRTGSVPVGDRDSEAWYLRGSSVPSREVWAVPSRRENSPVRVRIDTRDMQAFTELDPVLCYRRGNSLKDQT